MKTKKKTLFILYIIALFCCSFLPFTSSNNLKDVTASATNVYNNAIFVTFEDGDENWIDSTLTSYDNTYRNLYNNALNLSPNSVNNYYDTMSYGSLNLETRFYTKSNKAVVVPYTLNELLPYTPTTNSDGYFEYEAAVYSGSGTPSMLSQGYLASTHKYNIYTCAKHNSYHTGVPCDLDLSDGIGCQCAYEIAKESSSENLVLYKHVEQYFRLMIALKSALSQVNTSITGNVDYNNDNYVDMLSFVFPKVDSGKIKWGDLLWAHQGQLNISEFIPSYLRNSTMILNLLSTRGLRNATTSDIDFILNDYEISNKKPKNYICVTTEHLIGSTPLVDENGTKTLTNFVFAHELGHALGLPDYYVYDNDYETDPVSYWDLMGYNYNGFPIYMTSYSRELLGFTNSNNIKKIETNGTYTLRPTTYDEINNNSQNSNNVLAYYIKDENFPNQKIYLEYRYKQGKYDSGPTYKPDGLLIYRVDNGITQVAEYSNMLSSGNFYGYPNNIQVLSIKPSGSVGNNDTSSTFSAITFQSYDKTKNQSELTKSDITFVNTGIVIKDITINTETNQLTFTAQIKAVVDPVDLSSVSLNGANEVNHEVNTTYTDLGINFGEFDELDFDIKIANEVKNNILGKYTYSYSLTYKATNQTLTLTRTVNVKDTTKPTITLKGDTTLSLDNFDDYVEAGYDVSDNYDNVSSINVSKNTTFDSSTNTYTITYIATDSSGNSTSVTRKIVIIQVNLVQLKGEKEITHEVKTNYVDAGLNFVNCSEEDFNITPSTNININALGKYTYTYTIIEKTTSKQTVLTRTINVKDTTAPVITILNDVEIFKDEIDDYLSANVVDYSDNFYSKSDITFDEKKVSYENKVVLTYTATDPSGNKATKTRTFTFKYLQIQKSNITFTINSTSLNNKLYVNSTINLSFSIKANSALELSRMEELDQITWTIDHVVKDELNNKRNATLKFTGAGTHIIEISINGRKVYTKEITVTDPASNNASAASADNVSFLIIIGVIFAVGIVGIPVRLIIKKKQEDLDRY